MKLCSSKHDEVCFDDDVHKCPACRLVDAIENVIKAAKELRNGAEAERLQEALDEAAE